MRTAMSSCNSIDSILDPPQVGCNAFSASILCDFVLVTTVIRCILSQRACPPHQRKKVLFRSMDDGASRDVSATLIPFAYCELLFPHGSLCAELGGKTAISGNESRATQQGSTIVVIVLRRQLLGLRPLQRCRRHCNWSAL